MNDMKVATAKTGYVPPKKVPTGPPMTDTIRYLGDVQRLTLNPGDRIVLTLADRHLSDEYFKRLKEDLEEVFAGHRVLVIGAGTKIGVLGPD